MEIAVGDDVFAVVAAATSESQRVSKYIEKEQK